MSNEEFKKWAKASGFYEHTWADMERGWQARQPEIDALETENSRLSDSLEAIDLDTKRLVDEIAALQDEVDLKRAAMNGSIKSYEKKIAEQDKVIDGIALQKGILKAEVGRLESENAALKAEVERLRKDNQRLQDAINITWQEPKS